MRLVLSITCVLALSCGGSADSEASGSNATNGGETTSGVRPREPHEIPRAPSPWDEMSRDEKGRFMAEAVVPYMRELFREYDPEAYASFGCATCHGADMSAREFAMPSTGLLALHPSGSPEQRAVVEEQPRMTRFMFNHVVPAMRTMLGQPERDPSTGEGFSCYSCHPHAE